jgi:hypothetical protein
MKIVSQKVPPKMANIIKLVQLLNKQGATAVDEVCLELLRMEGSPDSSNATFKEIAVELGKLRDAVIFFEFYCSKNIFVGHKVISHAATSKLKAMTVNYNTRFHSAATFTTEDWFANFFHELTHLADQSSPYSFGHKNQNDENSAPEVVGRIARNAYQSREWL